MIIYNIENHAFNKLGMIIYNIRNITAYYQ